MQNNPNKTVFDPNSSFFELPIVKFTIWLGIILIAIIILLIAILDWRSIDISADGFNEILKMMKTPIFLLGFFAALLALFATNHRSEQNKASMEISSSQNRFSNYYKHIEEYKSYIDTHFETDSVPVTAGVKDNSSENIKVTVRVRRLHKALYPNAKTKGLNFSKKIELDIFDQLFRFMTCLSKTNLSSDRGIEHLVLITDDCMKSISALLLDSITYSKFSDAEVNFYYEERIIKIPNGLLSDYINSCITKFSIIGEILYFEENFNFELYESLLIHTKNTASAISSFSISGKNITFLIVNGSREEFSKKVAIECKKLSAILESVKKTFPNYNSYL